MSMKVVDPEAEVQKLKELVKKLERQNEMLRTQQCSLDLDHVETGSTDSSSFSSFPTGEINGVSTHSRGSISDLAPPKKASDSTSRTGSGDPKPPQLTNGQLNTKKTPSAHGDKGSSTTVQEEDAWLYKSPKKMPHDQLNLSPFQWMRSAFDSPTPEITGARRCLLARLEELRLTGRVSVGSGNSPSVGSNATTQLQDTRLCTQSPVVPSIKQPLLNDLSARVDTNTFTRPKKSRPSSSQQVHGPDGLFSHRMPTGSCDDLDKMQDMTDVRVIARMQEESLKAQVMGGVGHKSRTGSQLSIASSNGSDHASSDSPTGSTQRLNGLQGGQENARTPRRSLPSSAADRPPPSQQHSGRRSVESQPLVSAPPPKSSQRLRPASAQPQLNGYSYAPSSSSKLPFNDQQRQYAQQETSPSPRYTANTNNHQRTLSSPLRSTAPQQQKQSQPLTHQRSYHTLNGDSGWSPTPRLGPSPSSSSSGIPRPPSAAASRSIPSSATMRRSPSPVRVSQNAYK